VGSLVSALLILVLATGCGGGPPAEDTRPLDAGQLASNAERASSLDAPYRLVFEWSLTEPGMRMQGRGVARIEPPYRARLDLFSRNGERITSAALVDGDLRVPEGLPTFLPEATMFWASLGVFRPARGMGLVGGRWHRDGLAELHYRPGGDADLLIRLTRNRIQEVIQQTNGQVVEELRLRMEEDERFPRRATYRDMRQTRELTMTLESVENVESYPSDIWEPRR
jgi:hypothetical protein